MTKLITTKSISYHKKRLENFWNKWSLDSRAYKKIDWWIFLMRLDPMRAGQQGKALIKDFIRLAVIDKKISIHEAHNLWNMIKSEDQENQYVALNILWTHYPRAFVKEKSAV